MTFKDDLITDLDLFFNNSEFAVDVTYNAATIQGIFNDAFDAAVESEVGIESSVPQVKVRSSDVVAAVHNETMTINSVVYNIIGLNPDGTGITVVLLSQD
jgi:hypothetical protein